MEIRVLSLPNATESPLMMSKAGTKARPGAGKAAQTFWLVTTCALAVVQHICRHLNKGRSVAY